MKENYEKKVRQIAEALAIPLNLSIEDVEWVVEGGNNILRIIADSKDGLNIDEATELNNLISEALDKDEFIEEEYMLEVSSPGIEKVLKNDDDIRKNINEYVHIDFNDVFKLENYQLKDIEGYLKDYKDNIFYLEVNLKGKIKKVEVKKEEVKIIRKAIKF